MNSTVDSLLDQNADLKATLRGALKALKLVIALHEQPASANVPKPAGEGWDYPAGFYNVDLDPKAYEQVKDAMLNAEDILS